MSVIALTSAKGAPGVTTTALGLALAWPRPVLLLEADAAGSSAILAGFLRAKVPLTHGLIDLAMAHREGVLTQQLFTSSLELTGTNVRLIPGLANHAQAQSMAPVWPALAGVLADLDTQGMDVIIDAGRVSAAGAPQPLLRAADIVLLTSRTTLPAIAGIKGTLSVLAEDLETSGRGAATLELLPVGEGHPYTAAEIAKHLKWPVLGVVAFDPTAAEVYSIGATAGRRFASSPLARSLAATVTALQTRLSDRVIHLEAGERRHV
jgi:hypothetical protein